MKKRGTKKLVKLLFVRENLKVKKAQPQEAS